MNELFAYYMLVIGESRITISSLLGIMSSPMLYIPFERKSILFDGGILPVDITESQGRFFLDLGRKWIMLTRGSKQLKGLSEGSTNFLSIGEGVKQELIQELSSLS